MTYFSHRYIKFGQITALIISVFLLGFNVFYLIYDYNQNIVLLSIIMCIFLFLLNFLLSRFYGVRIESHKIILENFYQKRVTYHKNDLKNVSVYSMSFGIYLLSFVNGKSYFFTMSSTKQLRNLLILDKDVLEKKLNTEIKEFLGER